MIQSEMKRDKIELIQKRERANMVRKSRMRNVSPIEIIYLRRKG